jgi:hypothetical protein
MSRAHHDANVFANAHPDQTAPWLADVAKLDVTSILQYMRAYLSEVLTPTDIQPMIDAAAGSTLSTAPSTLEKSSAPPS